MEHKMIKQYQINVDKDERTVTGIPSVFGIADQGGDLIPNGAYKKTISERASKIKWLWYHNIFDTAPPIAKILDIREVGRDELPEKITSEFPNATGGLRVTRKYLDTPRADEIFTGIVEGVIDEMSVGIDVLQSEYPEDYYENSRQVNRIIKEVKLYEISDLLWGMNQATTNAKGIIDFPLAIKSFLRTGNLDDSVLENIKTLFGGDSEKTVELFQKVLGSSYTIEEKIDTIKAGDLKDCRNSDELLIKLLELELSF